MGRIGTFDRRWIALAVALAALAGEARAQTAPAAENACTGGDAGPAAALAWREVPSPDAIATTDGLLHLDVTSRGESPADLDVTVVADGGGTKTKVQPFRIRALAPGGSQAIEIDLKRLGVAKNGMRFAGQILASARVVPEGACDGGSCLPTNPFDDGDDAEVAPTNPRVLQPGPGTETIVSPAIYFHREDKTSFRLYGGEALKTRFGAGDLSGGLVNEERDGELERITAGKGMRNDAQLTREASIEALGAEHGDGLVPEGPIGGIPGSSARLCVKWEIGLADQGRVIETPEGAFVTEDFWNGWSSRPSGNGLTVGGSTFSTADPDADPANFGQMIVAARGARVRLRRGDYDQTFETAPSTGCFSFGLPSGNGDFRVTLYTDHRDSKGNRIRVKSPEGKTFQFDRFVPLPKGQTTVVALGAYTGRATLAAITGFSLYRSNLGLENKTIEVREVSTCAKAGGAASSAHVDFSGLAEGVAQVQIHDGTSPGCSQSDHRRFKFIVSHEIGHAWALLRFGVEGEEPGIDYAFADDDETVCENEALYTELTTEWSSVTAREGFAHFYAVEVWNSHASGNAVFTWFGAKRDAERNDPHAKGGRLLNNCDGTIKDGIGTNIDWMRFYWDLHAPFTSAKPSGKRLLDVYAESLARGNLTRDNYFDEFHATVVDFYPAFRPAFESFACWNGIDTQSNRCVDPYAYPDCPFPNPADGAGYPGCPCADVVETIHPSDIRLDGHYADGRGSYLKHGPGNLGQYCVDQPDGIPASGVCGQVDFAADFTPVCEVCGVDTNWGCPCVSDQECAGLDATPLACAGSPESGFREGGPGTCLPSPDTSGGRGLLVSEPWFCLDNCASKGSSPDQYACLFDQFPSRPQAHGECADVQFCSLTGFCEEGGQMCDADAICIGDDDCCKAECASDKDCIELGFPAGDYVCDPKGGETAKCVPAACTGDKVSDPFFCALYR